MQSTPSIVTFFFQFELSFSTVATKEHQQQRKEEREKEKSGEATWKFAGKTRRGFTHSQFLIEGLQILFDEGRFSRIRRPNDTLKATNA
jgi:hypothetical protein